MTNLLTIHAVTSGRPKILKTDIDSTTRFGVYIVQSSYRKMLFRIGATGIYNKGTMRDRFFTTHQGKRPQGKANLTMQNRPWEPRWVAEIKNGTPGSTAIAEAILFARFGQLYGIDHSIFYTTDDADKIAAQACLLRAELESVVHFQIAADKLRPPYETWPTSDDP